MIYFSKVNISLNVSTTTSVEQFVQNKFSLILHFLDKLKKDFLFSSYCFRLMRVRMLLRGLNDLAPKNFFLFFFRSATYDAYNTPDQPITRLSVSTCGKGCVFFRF